MKKGVYGTRLMVRRVGLLLVKSAVAKRPPAGVVQNTAMAGSPKGGQTPVRLVQNTHTGPTYEEGVMEPDSTDDPPCGAVLLNHVVIKRPPVKLVQKYHTGRHPRRVRPERTSESRPTRNLVNRKFALHDDEVDGWADDEKDRQFVM
ncbi:hypothetical protein AVEN_158260-1 [Araneus ventricosus]|uniref:Uncharacterized protein n=1 Tax=Araneus ventricosus TaxID=182803 RepID=A0A4Y2G2N8_ARAVE|nr:hypothetical protein AVEN_158260-1 [Araneus ventricosus]